MATQYPNGIDNTSSLPYVTNGASPMVGDDVNRLRDAIVAVETELGANPSGTFTSVDARLGAAESTISQYANSTFLVLSTDGFISQERVFAPAGNFAVVDGGAGANYQIDLANRVGIGTTSPAAGYSLTLTGDGSSRIGGVTLRSGSTDTFYLGAPAAADAANIRLLNPNAGYISFGTNNLERARITSGGSVGIGTVSPSERLHVSGGNLLVESAAGAGVPYATIKGTQGGVQLSSSSGIGKIDILNNSGTATISLLNAGDNRLVGANNADFSFYTNNTEKMRVTADGYFGVGTSSPLSLLAVGSSSQFRVNSAGNLSRINNVPYSFPGSQGAASSLLVNDGSGNLAWSTSISGITSSLSLPDGTGAAPSLSFSADADTGLYRPGSNQIGFSTGGIGVAAVDGYGIKSVSGAASNPSYSFLSDADTGIYNRASNQVGVATGGTESGYFDVSGIKLGFGTALAPSYAFASDTDTGIYRRAANQMGVASGGTESAYFDSGGVRLVLGSAVAPAYSFASYTGTGVYSSAADEIGFATAGAQRAAIDGYGMRSLLGTAPNPSYAFIGELNTGMYRPTPGQLGFAVAGAAAAAIDSAGIKSAITGTALSPSYSFTADSDTGMYRRSANQIGFSVGGNERATVDGYGIKSGPGTLSFPAYSFILDSSTGMYNNASGSVGISANGISAATFGENSVVLGNDFSASDSVTINGIVDIPTRTRIGVPAADPLEPLVSFAHQNVNSAPSDPLTQIMSSTYASDHQAVRMYSSADDLEDSDNAIFQIVVGANSTAPDLSWDFDVPDTASPSLVASRSATRLVMTGTGLSFNKHSNSAGYPWGNNSWEKQIFSAGESGLFLGVAALGIDGTAAVPAYSFSGSSNTGIYRNSTAGTISLSLSGVERLAFSRVVTWKSQQFFSSSDGIVAMDASLYQWGHWIANFTASRTLRIDNLIEGRMVYLYLRNTNGAGTRAIDITASTTTGGHSSVNMAISAGGASSTSIPLVAGNGTAVIWVANSAGTFIGGTM